MRRSRLVGSRSNWRGIYLGSIHGDVCFFFNLLQSNFENWDNRGWAQTILIFTYVRRLKTKSHEKRPNAFMDAMLLNQRRHDFFVAKCDVRNLWHRTRSPDLLSQPEAVAGLLGEPSTV